jgi:uncharacterized phage-associated protein
MEATKISKYIIAKYDNVGDLITNKKLQKLLYYIEAWSLVHLDSLIDEDFEAWVHGPVIPSLYQEYKHFSYSPIVLKYEKDIDSSKYIKSFEIESKLNQSYFTLIDAVLNKYGILSSRELELLSHSENPWLTIRKNLSPIDNCSDIISKKMIKEYYSSLIS